MAGIILETTRFLFLINRARDSYNYSLKCKGLLWKIFPFYGKNSRIYKLIVVFFDKIKVVLKDCFLGRISEINEGENSAILDQSKTVLYLKTIYKGSRDNFKRYLMESKIYILANRFYRRMCFFPLQAAAGIITVVLLTNIIILMFLNKIGVWGYFMRNIFLFTAIAVFSSEADWPAVKKSSLVLRLILKDKECAVFAEK